jgi:hypothetical protein
MNELQKMMPRLLEKHQDDTKLMRAAMANPILALESIGIYLSPTLQTEVERKVRFDASSIKKLNALEKEASKIAGKKLNLSSPTAVNSFLKKAIGNSSSQGPKKAPSKSLFDTISDGHRKPLAFATARKKYSSKDPLTAFKDQHELIPILIKHRSIEAAFPALASPAVFKKIAANKSPLTEGIRFKSVRFRLQDRAKRKSNA